MVDAAPVQQALEQAPREELGRVARWLWGEPRRDLTVHAVQDLGGAGYFQRQRVVRVLAGEGALPVVAGELTQGLCVVDGAEVHVLSPADGSLSAALIREARPLEAAHDLLAFARFVVEARLVTGTARQVVLAGPQELASWRARDGRRVDEGVCERLAERVEPPALEGDEATGWELRCATLAGWQDDTDELGLERVLVSPDRQVFFPSRTVLARGVLVRE